MRNTKWSAGKVVLLAIVTVLSPAILAFKYILAVILFPLKFIIMLAKVFYPIYVFLGVACVVGLITGIAGKYTLRLIVESLWSSKVEDRTKGSVRSRNRKRKDVGAQSYYQGRKRIRR